MYAMTYGVVDVGEDNTVYFPTKKECRAFIGRINRGDADSVQVRDMVRMQPRQVAALLNQLKSQISKAESDAFWEIRKP